MRYLSLILFVALLIGCAGGGAPVTPDENPLTDSTSQNITMDPGTRVLWGLYDVVLDPVEESAEIVPLRGAAFKANVTQFLQPPIGQAGLLYFDNLNFDDFFTDGIVTLEVAVTHPFMGLDRYRGFDVLGLFLADSSFSVPSDSSASIPNPDGTDPILLNADGYSRWFNPFEFPTPNIFGFVPGRFGTPGFTPNSIINGYKYFADGMDSVDGVVEFFDESDNLENRGSFTPGSTNRRRYEVRFPDPTAALEYQYAIIASWLEPANPSGPILDDFAMDANQAEAFLLDADTSASTAYYEDGSNYGGVIHMDLTVYDWQAMLGGDPVPDQVGAIYISNLKDGGMIDGGFVEVSGGAAWAADGAASSVVSFDIASITPSEPGDEMILVEVHSADPTTYDQGFGSPASNYMLAAYLMSSVTVLDENPANQAPSVGNITGEEAPMEINIEPYTIAAYDPESDPLSYEWSLVADGDPVDWGNVGTDVEEITIDWNTYGMGSYDLHCRVKDDFNPWQLAMNNPLSIEVSEVSITCGTGTYGYHDYAWIDNQAVEAAFLSDGTVLTEYGYSFTDKDLQVMQVNYEIDIGGYCYYTPVYDPCDDDWCDLWTSIYVTTSDPANGITHMDTDYAGTTGDGTETDDVMAYVQTNTPYIVSFIDGFNTTTGAMASAITSTSVGNTILAMDFDEDGDLWVLVDTGDVYELVKTSNYSQGSLLFTVDMATVAPGTTVVFDWAISYLTGDLYLYTDETVGGTIHRISGSSGTILDTVSNALDAGVTNPAYGLGTSGARGDIEIDHEVFAGENPLSENCRLVVSGGPGGTDQAAMFARYAQDLTLLSTWDNNIAGGGSCANPAGNDGGRFIIFDPVDHVDDPGQQGDEEAWDHAMWVGDAGTSTGNLVWASSCRPCPADWGG